MESSSSSEEADPGALLIKTDRPVGGQGYNDDDDDKPYYFTTIDDALSTNLSMPFHRRVLASLFLANACDAVEVS